MINNSKKIVYINIILLLLVCCNWSLAQEGDSLWSIKGKVLLQRSHKPSEYSNVYLKNTAIGTSTDVNGAFEFKELSLPEYILTYVNMGYIPGDTLVKRSDPTHNYILYLNIDCYYSEEKALKDIENEEAKLLIVGGIAPVIYQNEEDFEDKYDVEYYDFGCTPPAGECIKEYNETVFRYLDKKYGPAWRKEVRDDVFAL